MRFFFEKMVDLGKYDFPYHPFPTGVAPKAILPLNGKSQISGPVGVGQLRRTGAWCATRAIRPAKTRI